jgi:hypothetical protein
LNAADAGTIAGGLKTITPSQKTGVVRLVRTAMRNLTMTNRTTAELRELCRELYDIAQPLEGKTPFGKLVRIADRLTTLTLSLPQPPALGGIVEEIDKALDGAGFLSEIPFRPVKSVGEIRLDVPNVVGQINALIFLLNAWPTLRANLKQEEWQDISTAPKDGTRILINEGNEDYPEVVYWDPAYGEEGFYRNHATAWVNSSSEQIDEQPTHWKPLDLPTPPQSKKEG